MSISIVTWNVNSVKARLQHLMEFLEKHSPDFVCLQELKCETDAFPTDAFSSLPYNLYIHGQKSYNGVAILSKIPADEIKTDFPDNPIPEQARFIEGGFSTALGYFRIISLYVPNGGEVDSDKYKMKLDFYDKFTNYISDINSIDEHLCIGSDYNVAPFDIDVYNPKSLENSTCFTLPERKKMRTLINAGLDDCFRIINPTSKEFSWWDYRGAAFEHNKGMRIDTILANATATSKVKNAFIDLESRSKSKPSDHAPVIIVYGE